jgi:hypothetical protein
LVVKLIIYAFSVFTQFLRDIVGRERERVGVKGRGVWLMREGGEREEGREVRSNPLRVRRAHARLSLIRIFQFSMIATRYGC